MMRERLVQRYSQAFKRQVVDDIESGRFASIAAASLHHGIAGKNTVRNWVLRLGKNHLLAKVVRVEKPDEASQLSSGGEFVECRVFEDGVRADGPGGGKL
jgi:transposase-like protein